MEKDFLAGKKSAEEIEELGAGALRNAVIDGDVVDGSVMAGQIAGLVKEEESRRYSKRYLLWCCLGNQKRSQAAGKMLMPNCH